MGETQLQNVKEYMALYLEHHAYDRTVTGRVLDGALASEGKMIRPRLLLLASEFGPDRDLGRLHKLAAIVEMTHLASLIHDDIVDDAPLRRGKASVQAAYGKSAAVYAGDFVMSRITACLMSEGFNESGLILARTVEAMCAGEIGQARCRYKSDVSVEEYFRNIHGKTAALFAACCHIGALESGCGDVMLQKLKAFGECLGYLFQIRDDILDFYDGTDGKVSHCDFRDGIYTLPVILAAKDRAGKQRLLPYMEQSAAGTLTDAGVAEMEVIVSEYGGLERAVLVMRDYQSQAQALVRQLPENAASDALLRLIRKLGSV